MLWQYSLRKDHVHSAHILTKIKMWLFFLGANVNYINFKYFYIKDINTDHGQTPCQIQVPKQIHSKHTQYQTITTYLITLSSYYTCIHFQTLFHILCTHHLAIFPFFIPLNHSTCHHNSLSENEERHH